ncbi:MAG: SDR family oxidoreductase [Parvularculaceae bacterium]|nr:SDR family oxidoreductase [Parvularculaceae bacterium]
MASPFEGKVCVVSGAGSGIGRAVAMNLARQGAALAISDVNPATLEETRAMLPPSNRIRADVLDVADADAIAAYAPKVKESLGSADYVFNIAGLSRVGDFEKTPLESFEKVMNVNFWGVVRMSKAFLPQLLETRGGLINISSVFGIIGVPGQAHYCASKFGVRGFSESPAQELDGRGVRVTTVHPGGVATNIAKLAEVDALTARSGTKEQMVDRFAAVAKTSPDRAAEIILKGVERGQRRVLIGNDASVISWIQRLFPIGYPKWIARMTGSEGV